MKKYAIPILYCVLAGACASTLGSCSTTSRARTAHYRGDVLYGDDTRSNRGKNGKTLSATDIEEPYDPILKSYSNELSDPLERALVAEIEGWLGTPYKWGGHSKQGTDCSGMVMEIFHKVTGVKLPRVSREQSDFVFAMTRESLHPGDLLFFAADTMRNAVSHVGMYVGKGQMIHASTSRGVVVANVDHQYWVKRLCNAGRVASAKKAWQQQREEKIAREGHSGRLEIAIDEKTDSILSSIFMD